jgi:hypothetical protein
MSPVSSIDTSAFIPIIEKPLKKQVRFADTVQVATTLNREDYTPEEHAASFLAMSEISARTQYARLLSKRIRELNPADIVSVLDSSYNAARFIAGKTREWNEGGEQKECFVQRIMRSPASFSAPLAELLSETTSLYSETDIAEAQEQTWCWRGLERTLSHAYGFEGKQRVACVRKLVVEMSRAGIDATEIATVYQQETLDRAIFSRMLAYADAAQAPN